MMGGGFGGCTINIVKSSAVNALIEQLTEQYELHTKKKLISYLVDIEDGAQKILVN